MTIQQIKYILGVAENGSLNRASEKLYISQPSLTSSIHDAEYELGFKIFNRTSRGITVTERGGQFISEAKQVYESFNSLIKKFSGNEHKKFQTM